MTDEGLRLRERATLMFVGAVAADSLSVLTFSVSVGNPQLNGIAALAVFSTVVFSGATIALAKNLRDLAIP